MSSAMFDKEKPTPEKSTSETSEATPEVTKELPIPFFDESAEAKKININRDIRHTIGEALKDRELFKEVCSYLMPEGRTGNRMMDMGLACREVLNHTDLEERYAHMNEKLCSDHLTFVLRGRGYVMDKGRLTGHTLIENKSQGQ